MSRPVKQGLLAAVMAVTTGMTTATTPAAPATHPRPAVVPRAEEQAPPPLPDGLLSNGDLRGRYRAAFCGRSMLAPDECGAALRTFAGEVAMPRPVAATAAAADRYRLLFVPGFLAACFPGIHSFADMIEAARVEGFQAQALDVGGRNGVAANARLLAQQVDRLPVDGRRLLFVGHSKGALDVLAMLGSRPDIAARTAAVLTIAGALQGSPLADGLREFYAATIAVFPFAGCARGDGDPMADLAPAASRIFWEGPAGHSGVPLYAIAAMPDLDHLSPGVLPTYMRLASIAGANDGMVPLRNQVVPAASLLGVMNADHLRVAIPFPGPAFVLLFNAEPFPRAAMLLAAVDVIADHEAARTRTE